MPQVHALYICLTVGDAHPVPACALRHSSPGPHDLADALLQAQQVTAAQGMLTPFPAGALRDSSADPQDLAAALLQAQQLSAAQLEALEQTLRGRILDQLAGPSPADAAPAAVQGSTEQERLASADEVIRRLQG